MTPLLPAPFPLADGEHAFTLDTGETAVVAVTLQPYRPADGHLMAYVAGRLVDPATGATLLVGGHAVTAPSQGYGLTTEAIAAGASLAVLLADGIQEQAERARRVAAALTSITSLGGAVAATV